MTEKGKIFKGYAEQIIAHHEFGSNKMVALSPDYFTVLDTIEACKIVDELVADGYLRKYNTVQTMSHGSKGFKVVSKCPHWWIGLTQKGWEIAPKYLNA